MPKETPSSQRQAWQDRFTALQDLPQLWRFVRDSSPSAVYSTIAARLLGGLTPLIMLYAAKQVVDIIAPAAKGHSTDMRALWFWVAVEFALVAAAQALGRLIDFLDILIGDRYRHSLSLKIMHHAASLDLATFEDPAFHDRLERARAQSTDRTCMLTSAGWLLQRAVMLVSLAGGIIFYSPWLFVVLIVSVIPAFLVESHFAFLGYTLAHELTPTRRSLDYYLALGSSREAAKEVKVFALAKHLETQYSHLSRLLMVKNRRLAARRLLWGALLSILSTAGYYGSYAYLAHEAALQRISVGTFTFLVAAIAGANGHLQTIFSLFSGIADQALFLRDLILFFEEKPAIRSSPNSLPAPRPIRLGLVFEDVTFCYPGNDKPVLHHLNLQFRHGARVALVGENGEGKTTLVKLIARLYDPTEGRMLLDGRDLRDYDVEDLRAEIGIIFQDFIRYDLTVRQNIAVGSIGRLHDDEALLAASGKSNANDLLDQFSTKLDQMLGSRFAGGVDLSGGRMAAHRPRPGLSSRRPNSDSRRTHRRARPDG